MGAGDGRTEAIMREIASLRAQRDELDSRIRFFESQLRAGGAAPTTLPPSLSTKLDAMGVHAAAAGGGLSSDMVRRYSRHLLLPDFGVQGQRRLSRSSVLVVGAGGLGSAVALYLAACGVGSLGIADGENVELSNLHGQIIHVEAYVGQPKVKSAASACRAINSSIKVFEHHLKLKSKNALDVVRQYDIIVDATNSPASRYMLNDCCVLLQKPLISGSTIGLEGQLTVYNHNGSPCYRCLFPNPAACQSGSDNGILGVVPGVIGCLQALEAIKVATRICEPLRGRMIHFDALSSRFKTVKKIHQRSSTCMVCGDHPNLTKDDLMMFDYDSFAESSNSSKRIQAAA
ncbi:adenylyltransferase and sulfurtransferase MOCS3-1-like isoform X2 [Panicum hallii]|uniref:adenylyltransferase and sulfurtransferase MOCS3-1-like isoform X2 n=1 Tax=Panicum hallii TaxID=206008 RepID=UPI000DF4DEF5|nr:adenylyltransferase and sulfurtransferase MOCS3-1-like isoform X2 [Panicum hallii]